MRKQIQIRNQQRRGGAAKARRRHRPPFSCFRSFARVVGEGHRRGCCIFTPHAIQTVLSCNAPATIIWTQRDIIKNRPLYKSLNERTLGQRVALGRVKAMQPEEARALFAHPADQLVSGLEIELMGRLTEAVEKIETEVLRVAGPWRAYQRLQELPGIGKILGLTIALETGDAQRFAGAGNFASYCRCVQSLRQSNDKKKGENNRKCGNKYLAWAFVEAAHFACRYDAQCRRFYDRKKQKTNPAIATKALACKLAKAAWHVMQADVPYDATRVFGPDQKAAFGETGREPEKGSGPPSLQN